MTEILHNDLPPDLRLHAPLPGVAPLGDGRWLRVDEAYAELRSSIDVDEWEQLFSGLERLAALDMNSPDERPAVNQ